MSDYSDWFAKHATHRASTRHNGRLSPGQRVSLRYGDTIRFGTVDHTSPQALESHEGRDLAAGILVPVRWDDNPSAVTDTIASELGRTTVAAMTDEAARVYRQIIAAVQDEARGACTDGDDRRPSHSATDDTDTINARVRADIWDAMHGQVGDVPSYDPDQGSTAMLTIIALGTRRLNLCALIQKRAAGEVAS